MSTKQEQPAPSKKGLIPALIVLAVLVLAILGITIVAALNDKNSANGIDDDISTSTTNSRLHSSLTDKNARDSKENSNDSGDSSSATDPLNSGNSGASGSSGSDKISAFKSEAEKHNPPITIPAPPTQVKGDGNKASAQNTEKTSPNSAPSAGSNNAQNTAQPGRKNRDLSLLSALAVKGKASRSGYSRGQFGPAWDDVDHNNCDTRNDILNRDLVDKTYKSGTCKVATGILHDPYTGRTINFRRGNKTSAEVQIDHVVALSNAWQTGAQELSPAQRLQLANDPLNLLAVEGKANMQKGDADTAAWIPKNKSFRCTYVGLQIEVKAKYHLWVTKAEKEAMERILERCPANF